MNKKNIRRFLSGYAIIVGLLVNNSVVFAEEKDNWQQYYPRYNMSYYLDDVANDKKVTITFSKAIDKKTITNRNIELIDSSFQNEINVYFKLLSDRKIQVIPRENLKSGQTYFVIIHDGVRALNGASMENGIVTLLKVKSAPVKPPNNSGELPTNSNNINFQISESDPNKIRFVQSVIPASVGGYQKYKVFASITVAQAILESAWGTSDKAVQCNNLFGVKARGEWTGPYLELPTKEWENGKFIDIIDRWRVYTDIYDSIEDHGKHISITPCYRQNGVFDALNYKEQAKALSRAGYATDPQYAEKLCNIINKYSLWKLDPNGRLVE